MKVELSINVSLSSHLYANTKKQVSLPSIPVSGTLIHVFGVLEGTYANVTQIVHSAIEDDPILVVCVIKAKTLLKANEFLSATERDGWEFELSPDYAELTKEAS